MPRYEVKMIEVYEWTYKVEAKDEHDAIRTCTEWTPPENIDNGTPERLCWAPNGTREIVEVE